MSAPSKLAVTVEGRAAPQGSKHKGSAGQMREASRYLPAWRAAVKRAIYERYRELGVEPGDLPLFVGPVTFGGVFWMPDDRRVDSPPDLDKLLRAVWDVCSEARVWEDDGRVVLIRRVEKRAAEDDWIGAHFTVWPVAQWAAA